MCFSEKNMTNVNSFASFMTYIIIIFNVIISQNSFCWCDDILFTSNSQFSQDNKPSNNLISDTRNITEKSLNPQKYRDILKHIKKIKDHCGRLCETEDVDSLDSNYISSDRNRLYKYIDKLPNCNGLWNSSIFDLPSDLEFPLQKVPKYLVKYFTHNGRTKISYNYRDDKDNENHTSNAWAWTIEGMEWHREMLVNKKLKGSYGINVVKRIINLSKHFIAPENKHILVIGSTRPWIEAILIALGAKHITTLEYNPYPTNHPKITTISPIQFSKLVMSGKAPLFDAMVTFSSLEHSGLGRYGDQLNPWGDIITMGRAWCQLKPGSRALVGLPAGNDMICFNTERRYGPYLYSQLFANWKQIYSEVNADSPNFKQKDSCYDRKQMAYQPILIVEK